MFGKSADIVMHMYGFLITVLLKQLMCSVPHKVKFSDKGHVHRSEDWKPLTLIFKTLCKKTGRECIATLAFSEVTVITHN